MSTPTTLAAQLLREHPELTHQTATSILALVRDWLNDHCYYGTALALDDEIAVMEGRR